MASKKRPRARKASILLEQIREQNRATIEAIHATTVTLNERFNRLQANFDRRFEQLQRTIAEVHEIFHAAATRG